MDEEVEDVDEPVVGVDVGVDVAGVASLSPSFSPLILSAQARGLPCSTA